MDTEDDRKDPPEVLPVRHESVEESSADLAAPFAPEQLPMASDVAPATPVASAEAEGVTGESFDPAPLSELAGNSPNSEADGSAGVVPSVTIVHERDLGTTPTGPTEPSHEYVLPLPEGTGVSELDPDDGISRILGPPADGHQRPRMPLSPPAWSSSAAPSASSPGRQTDRGRLPPSILVTVMLGYSRDMFEQAVEAAIQRATQKFTKIAKQEIDMFAFDQRAARRAADYRLRGPNPQ